MNRYSFAGLVAALGLAATATAHGQVLYAADGAQGNPSKLYLVNPANGQVTATIGDIGFAVTGLAFHPLTGILYGTTGLAQGASANEPPFPGNLIRIDIGTGQGTRIGPLSPNTGPETCADIAFDSSGTLFGWLEPGTDDLVKINLTSGAATVVGESNLNTYGAGLAISPSGTVFFAGTGDTPSDDTEGLLFTLNKATGAVANSIPFTGQVLGNGDPISTLAFSPNGDLFGARLLFEPSTIKIPRASQLVRIEPKSGAITTLGPSVNRLDALAFGPAVECFLLLGRTPLSFDLPYSPTDRLLVFPEYIFPMSGPADTPVFQIPDDPVLLGVHVYSQVYLDDVALFPGDQFRMSNGIDVALGVAAAAYGPSSGIQLWLVQPPKLGGVLEHGFVIQ